MQIQEPPRFRRTGHIGMSPEAKAARRTSIGGSDARIIMSGDPFAIEDLWMEKRGESFDTDFSEILFIQLGNITEEFNLDWFEFETGMWVTNEQEKRLNPEWSWAHATLDGIARNCETCPEKAVVEAKFMLPFNWNMDDAVQKYYAQVQHNMRVSGLEEGFLSVITGGGQWKTARIEADFFYQVAMQRAEEDFWDAVQTGRLPNVHRVEQPQRLEPSRVVDMSSTPEWAALARQLTETVASAKQHDSAKRKIKKLFPEQARIARAHGVTLKRGKDGRTLFEVEPAVALSNAA